MFLELAQKQVNLKKITLACRSVWNYDKKKLDEFVTAILQIPSTREIQLFFYSNNIHWKSHWSTLLNSSYIEILRIRCDVLTFERTQFDSYPCNKILTNLSVRVKTSFDTTGIIPMLKTLQNLKNLYLSHIDEDIVKSVQTKVNIIKD